MYFEVVTRNTPDEGVRYHGRLRKDDGQIVWTTPLWKHKESIYNSIEVAKKYAAASPTHEVIES
jgi:uncharacterized protein YegP (UPF0339 family)